MYSFVKRISDIIVSFAALLFVFPLLLMLIVIIRAQSEGSPLFLQKRIGINGKQFTLVKLRSMVKNAAQTGPFNTSDGDKRITPFGHFLRKTSLDELPQLWNVLIGDMSLIGPRPETPVQEALYGADDWKARHRVRPGITGLAQVNGRSSLSPGARLAFDLEYADNYSFMMDMKIAIKTLLIIFTGKGAN